MKKKNPKKKLPHISQQWETVGTKIIAHEVAIVSLCQALARTHRSTGEFLVKALQDNCTREIVTHYPGVREEMETYISFVQGELSRNLQ